MAKLNLDVFKISLLIILVWIAYSLYNLSNNGRYQFDNTDYSLIIDTRTGKTYEINYDEGKSVELTKKIE